MIQGRVSEPSPDTMTPRRLSGKRVTTETDSHFTPTVIKDEETPYLPN